MSRTLDLAASALMLRSYLAGLTLSNNGGTPNTKVDVAAGTAVDDANSVVMILAAGVTIDATTVGANGLDAGSLANTTWYHAYLIQKIDGTTAALLSTSVSSPTLPSGYIFKRRIGSVRTDGSAHLLGFVQVGDEFTWNLPVTDVSNANLSNSSLLFTLTVPTGVSVIAKINADYTTSAGAGQYALISSALIAVQVAGSPAGNFQLFQQTAGQRAAGQLSIVTDTSARIRAISSDSSSGNSFFIVTTGWTDRRGRDA